MGKSTHRFNVQAFLDTAGLDKTIGAYRRAEVIFSQGDACDRVMYIQKGQVTLTALSTAGRDVVVAVLGAGDFFGEGCLAGQTTRVASATATTPTTVLTIRNSRMLKALHQEHGLSDRFIAHMLSRNAGTQRDLLGQFFDSDERRLARALLSLARYGRRDKPRRVVSKMSRDTLSDLIGASRSQVSVFMNRFKKRGFIEFGGSLADGITINNSLLNVVLHD